MPSLKEWLNVEKPAKLSNALEKLQEELIDNVETWNEDELKMLFIAPFLKHFKFNNPPTYRVYTQRYMSLKTDDYRE